MARALAIALLAALVLVPASALAAPAGGGGSALTQQQAPSGGQQLLQDTVPQQAPAPVQQQQTEVDSGSLGTGETLLVALGILALIGGIWLVISRDAKRVTARASTATGGSSATRAAHRSRKLSAAERKRRKRGRAR